MKNLLSYILEKLVINKNSKVKYQRLKNNDIPKDLLIDSFKSIFISIFKNRTYKEASNCNYYYVKRSEIDWKDVIEILNIEYNHNLDPEYANDPNNNYRNIMAGFLGHIENLINMHTVYLEHDKERLKLDGRYIYKDDWVPYRDKYNLK